MKIHNTAILVHALTLGILAGAGAMLMPWSGFTPPADPKRRGRFKPSQHSHQLRRERRRNRR